MTLPDNVTREFVIVPPTGGAAALRVEITLVTPTLKMPLLRPAVLGVDGILSADPASGDITASFPKVLLVVTAMPDNPDATAKFAPARDADGALVILFAPAYALFGAGTVLGLGLPSASVDFDAPGGMVLRFPEIDVFVAPPGIPALAMHGGGNGLVFEAGNGGGLSGDLHIVAAEGAAAAARPRFIKSLAAHVRLARNSVMLLVLAGKIELSAEITRQLGSDIGDGPTDLDYVLTLVLLADWTASLKLRGSGGEGFLWRSQRGQPHVQSLARDTMGAYAVFAPLLAGALPGAGSSGYVDLALGAGLAAGLAAPGFVTTERITVLGADLVVRPVDNGGREGAIFFDVEAELNLNAGLGGVSLIKSRRAIKVRQKAVGLKLGFGPQGGAPVLAPVFDPLQGFGLDLSDPGTFDVPPPLGEFLQPDAARMARDNPLVFEVDLITKVDLGIVTINRASIRVPLEGGVPTLTGLGARLDVGMVQGSGHIRLLKNGVDGGFDASLAPPLGLRVGARLSIEKDADILQLLLGLDVEWPIPIPLGNSGLGLFGFLGLFATNKRRDQPEGQTALDWLRAAPDGDPAKSNAWIGERGAFALGLGAVLGTLEGGFLFNAKGMLMIELPGPRLLIMMKATVMLPRPPIGGESEGVLLAVIEISDKAISLGIFFEYGIPFLLELRVPVQTGFSFENLADWYFDAGSVEKGDFISVRFMSSIRADGYLMIHGNGIKSPLHVLTGFSVAAGIQAAMTWGPVPIGLYIKVGVGADVAISFKPILMIGQFSLEGELHLFIVSIGVKASALLQITDSAFYVKARVEGHVDFFFFEVSGGVTFELGDSDLELPPADPLIRALSLHSRSTTQLLPGQAADAPVDASLGECPTDSSLGNFTVPIDAIPVLQFEMRAFVAPEVKFLDQAVHSLLDEKAWVKRADRSYRYAVTRLGFSCDAAAPVTAGETPLVWWDRKGNPAATDDSAVQLALLSWLPDPTPAAALRTESRDKHIIDRWGTACDVVARETGVLWTFLNAGQGPSARGWTLTGTAYPDDPGTVRSSPPSLTMAVTECWRTGQAADNFVKVMAASVTLGQNGPSCRYLLAPKTGRKLEPVAEGEGYIDSVLAAHAVADLLDLDDAVRLQTDGLRELRGLALMLDPEAGKLVVRGYDAQDGVQFEDTAPANFPAFAQLPGRWTDPAGPWHAIVQLIYGDTSDLHKCFFDFKLPPGTAYVTVGFAYNDERVARLPRQIWGLLAAEVVTEAEIGRREWDDNRQTVKRTVIDGALKGDQGNRALLQPNATYSVTVDYRVQTSAPDTDGNLVEQAEDRSQTFQFKTDAAPPDRLDARVMATAPAEGEEAFFCSDPVRVVFSSGEVRKLYSAYGRELVVVVKAATGKHPVSDSHIGDGIFALDSNAISIAGLATLAMTPFEDAVRDVLGDLPCLDIGIDDSRHEVLTVKID
ncbi:MAG: hypothetical protein H7317_09775, partial [Pseudorhodobacter sp.]|nr:hypothetical protein [Pseudorhodobacter sp.]